jgi:hypothetical protein
MAKNINGIYRYPMSDEWYVNNKKTGNVLYKNENLENVVNWFIFHYDQYRKVLN